MRKERIFIKTFGNKTSSALSVDVVPLNIISDQKIVTVEAICTQVICTYLFNQNIQHVSAPYRYFTGLKLADNPKNLNKQIEILIGSDCYYSFVLGEVLKAKVNELVAINFLFRWILSRRFHNPTSVNLNTVHVLRIHTETMSENIFNGKLDSSTKHVLPCHHDSTRFFLYKQTCFKGFNVKNGVKSKQLAKQTFSILTSLKLNFSTTVCTVCTWHLGQILEKMLILHIVAIMPLEIATQLLSNF